MNALISNRRFAMSFWLAMFVLVTGYPGETSLAQSEAESESSASDDRFENLFDGTDLDHFRGYKTEQIGEGWKIADGTLYFDGSGGGDIVTRKEYSDFELTFDWKVAQGSNSGVMYRVSLGDAAPYVSGPEYQILDNEHHGDGRNSQTSAASLYAMFPASGGKLNPVGEWNSAKIVVNGDRVEHWLNGEQVVSVEIGSQTWQKQLEASKFRDWEKFASNRSGHIAFQDHGDEVWFRDIKVRSISADDD